jgi:hypothetical protein
MYLLNPLCSIRSLISTKTIEVIYLADFVRECGTEEWGMETYTSKSFQLLQGTGKIREGITSDLLLQTLDGGQVLVCQCTEKLNIGHEVKCEHWGSASRRWDIGGS